MEEVTSHEINFYSYLVKTTTTKTTKKLQFLKHADIFLKLNVLYLKSSKPSLDLLMCGEDELTSGHHAGE